MYTKPNYNKTVFVSDPHAPYHDIKAISLCIEFIKYLKPDRLIFLGDVIDCYSLSHFLKDPDKAMRFPEELETAKYIINLFYNAAPRSEKHFLQGNHEFRLQKYLWGNAPHLSRLPSNKINELLTLNKFGIEYHDTGRMIIQNTVVKHGNYIRKYAGYSARAELDSEGMSGVSAHTHRLGIYRTTKAGGDYAWMESGHLANPNQEYLEGKTADWQQGFGIGFYKEGARRFKFQDIEIIQGKIVYDGKEFLI